MVNPRLASLALACLALPALSSLGGCGGSDPAPEGGAAPAVETPKGPPKKEMPKYDKSGILEEIKKWQDLRGAVKYAKTKEEKAAAEQAVADFQKAAVEKWGAKGVPAPEGYYLGILHDAAGDPVKAVLETRRYLDVAPEDHVNAPHALTLIIKCQSAQEDFDGAEATLAKGLAGTFQFKQAERAGAEATLAAALVKAGRFESAARHYEAVAALGTGDPESVIFAADCLQRIGRAPDGAALARKSVDLFKDQAKNADRMKLLARSCELVGQPAPGFEGARHWKGVGGPVVPEGLQGQVTVVFAWKMESRWIKQFFQRINQLHSDFADRGVQVIGISRLWKYDPSQGGTVADMTDERELEFYDMWAREYSVNYPLAVGAYGDESLMDAWAARVVPSEIVVGKDGKVAYTRVGKEEEHFAALRQMIEKELAK